MRSMVVRILGAVGAVALSAMMLGSGVAHADPLTGKTYSEAATVISKMNGTPVIATVSGSQLDMDNCIVTSWHKSNFLDASGKNPRHMNFILHLNCNNGVASAGEPGNSAMSKEGIAAKTDIEAATNINANPTFCDKNEAIAQWCAGVCKRTGLCEG